MRFGELKTKDFNAVEYAVFMGSSHKPQNCVPFELFYSRLWWCANNVSE